MLTTGFPRFNGDLFGHFILELAKELQAQGTTVDVVAPHEAGLPLIDEIEGVSVRRFRYMWPARLQRLAYGGGMPTNLKKSWLARFQVPFFIGAFLLFARRTGRDYQLIHCHWTPTGIIGRWAARGRPLVLSVRGTDVKWMENPWIAWINRRVYRWMDRIVAVSAELAAKLESNGVKKGITRVVYNGVDGRFAPGCTAAARRALALPADLFTILFVGLLVPVKGLDMLFEALEILADEQIFCALVGDGPQQPYLENRARQAGMAERLRFAGRRPTAEVPQWLNAADVLVLPSQSEGRPNVVLEAQACGKAVIATRVGGTPELIKDGETGLLVESSDAVGLAAALRRLKGDRAFCQQLGDQARHHIITHDLSWKGSAAQMGEIYRELTGS
jgi:glycosyltransferase involved in cell wall biosynthesis